MSADLWGNPVSGDDSSALAAIDRFAGGLVAYRDDLPAILAAADLYPAHPLVQTYAGILHMLAEQAGAEMLAKPFSDRAGAAAANPRERGLADALAHWIDARPSETIAALEAVLAAYPRDLATLKLLHYHLFNRGAFAALLRSALLAVAALPEVAYVHGMAAFGYEQLHLLDEAEAAAWRALALHPAEPWAEHALAHVMLTQGRIDEGIAFLEKARAGWSGLNSFMLTHLWWHLALFYLSAGREAEALAIYDEQVWAVAKDYSQDQIGAVSLLARLEVAGVAIGARWRDLGAYLAVRAGDTVQPFLSVQYLYGLARAGAPEADRLRAAIAAAASDSAREDREAWADAALPLADGLLAHARGDFATAAERIGAALPALQSIGGSHAQRDLFDLLLVDAQLRSGAIAQAQQALELRRAHDPVGVPVNRQLAFAYRALGLPDQATVAETRVRERLAG
ncbi:MAG TPA: tetratricopeptide repeat protein [Sphingomonas sp.]